MKRVLSFLLIAALILSFSACSSEPENVYDALIGGSSPYEKEEEESASDPELPDVTASQEPESESESESEAESESESESETESEASESETSEAVTEIKIKSKIDVYKIGSDEYVKSVGTQADITDLNDDEYYSFSMEISYNGTENFIWEDAYVVVDGGEKWGWGSGEASAHSRINFRIYYVNMQKCMTPGEHIAQWYINGEEIHSERFVISESFDWAEKFEIPEQSAISKHNAASICRSPYISGWFILASDLRYTEYAVDFKADHLPKGTYCCLGNWMMDYSYLESQYASVNTEYSGVSAYAGFQNIHDGSKVAIMSFWDVYCKDEAGNTTVIRAKQIYPENAESDSFSGEGTGARALVPYDWQEDHWYRMHIKCTESEETGNTVVEQWVCDLETENWTLLSAYDIGFENSAFKGSIAIFLENYLTEYSGDVRSMLVRNPMYKDVKTGQWVNINEVYLSSNGGLPTYEGSYNFGTEDNMIWMITSGVGGDWFNNGKGKAGANYTFR